MKANSEKSFDKNDSVCRESHKVETQPSTKGPQHKESVTLDLEELHWCLRRFGAKSTEAEICVGFLKSWRKEVHPEALAIKAQSAPIRNALWVVTEPSHQRRGH